MLGPYMVAFNEYAALASTTRKGVVSAGKLIYVMKKLKIVMSYTGIHMKICG